MLERLEKLIKLIKLKFFYNIYKFKHICKIKKLKDRYKALRRYSISNIRKFECH